MARSLDERFDEIERLLAELRRDVAAQAQEPRPRGKGPDPAAAAEQWVRGLGWDETFNEAMVEEELSIIEQTRSQMARILRKLPAEALQRSGTHNERGPRTLDQLLTTAIGHIPHHATFIAEKRRALGLKS